MIQPGQKQNKKVKLLVYQNSLAGKRGCCIMLLRKCNETWDCLSSILPFPILTNLSALTVLQFSTRHRLCVLIKTAMEVLLLLNEVFLMKHSVITSFYLGLFASSSEVPAGVTVISHLNSNSRAIWEITYIF